MLARSLLAALLVCSGPAHATSAATPATRAAAASPLEARLAAYRTYALAQSDMLVGMTKVLAREIRDGNLDAAQSAYAPAHRYLARLEPVARLWPGLQARMDAPADASNAQDADAAVGGFHRIERGLFADRSTRDLTKVSDRLSSDARELRERIKLLDIEPGALFDGAARLTREIADQRLAGGAEPYAKTDLWDLEANIDGVREVVALAQAQLQAEQAGKLAGTAAQFVAIDDLLARHKAGCGFKSFDELGSGDKAALKAQVAVLADTLSMVRTRFASN